MKNKNCLSVLLISLAAGLIFQCTQRFEKKDIVAKWRDIEISLPDFERSYFIYWQMVKVPDSPELRQGYAQQMIEQELIARIIKTKKLELSPLLEKQLKRDSDRFIRQRYLEVVLQEKIPQPSDAEVQVAFYRQHTQLHVHQIYAREEQKIREIEKRLLRGESFDRIIQETQFDTTRIVQGGRLGWLSWGNTDFPVEDVLYRMRETEISKPVQSLMGWHILRVDSIRQTLSFGKIQQTEFELTRFNLRNRHFDLAVAHHLREKIWERKLVVKPKVLNQIWMELAPMLPKFSREWAMTAPDQLTEIPLPDFAEQVVATVDDEPFTVKEFFDAIPDLPRGLLQPNLKKALEIAIRDKIVTGIAREAGFDQNPVVQEKRRRAEITYSYAAVMTTAADSIRKEPIDLRDYFEKHKERFRTVFRTEVYEILVANSDTALMLAKRIYAGEDFASMAARYSLRDSIREKGGYLGYVAADDGAIGAISARLSEGDLYAPIESPEGFSLIKIGKKEFAIPDFETIKTKVVADGKARLFDELHQSLLPIEYNPLDIIFYTENLKRAFLKSTTIF